MACSRWPFFSDDNSSGASAAPDRSEDFDVQDAVVNLARDLDVPPAQLAVAWLHHKPGICAPIVGATKRNHITDAIASLELQLDPEIVYLKLASLVAGAVLASKELWG